jgi:shikimate kinase
MLVLIVGPSGVGKTSTLRPASRNLPNVVFLSLDHIISVWAQQQGIISRPDITEFFLNLRDYEKMFDHGMMALKKVAKNRGDRNVVVDVGAGFQCSERAKMLSKHFKTISITADPKIVYQRIRSARDDNRSLEAFLESEFSPSRAAIYQSAHHVIDSTSQTLDQTAAELSQLLASVFTVGGENI